MTGDAGESHDAAGFVDKELMREDLLVDMADLPQTARDLRDLFAKAGSFFEVGGYPAEVVTDKGLPMIVPLDVHRVVMRAHDLCRPVKLDEQGKLVPVTLPERVTKLYLAMRGDWLLRPLAGIGTSVLLRADGSISSETGYDPETQLWCAKVPALDVPTNPRREDAARALSRVRRMFRTFPFADSPRKLDADLRVEVIDVERPPGSDESAFLNGLLTAVCRPSMKLAPGFLVTAPSISGAGNGKGLLVRAISEIAFATAPAAVTAGGDKQELDKRIAAELVAGHPALFLDNVNGTTLRSDLLASVMTERPARVRLLGKTQMVDLNSAVFVGVTGNGLTVSLDLARRFLDCRLDAGCEDPESRDFKRDFIADVRTERAQLLVDLLTIWRWGRQSTLPQRGRPLGSYQQFCEWVRDPLLAQGCKDPVARVAEIKAKDPAREAIGELFAIWWKHHGATAVQVSQLHETVRKAADPHERGRQYVEARLRNLDGTRLGGFVLTRQACPGKWGAATYRLQRADAHTAIPAADVASNHGGLRGHGGLSSREPPMAPMPVEADDQVDSDECLGPGEEVEL